VLLLLLLLLLLMVPTQMLFAPKEMLFPVSGVTTTAAVANQLPSLQHSCSTRRQSQRVYRRFEHK
jgi:hypothetical protein